MHRAVLSLSLTHAQSLQMCLSTRKAQTHLCCHRRCHTLILMAPDQGSGCSLQLRTATAEPTHHARPWVRTSMQTFQTGQHASWPSGHQQRPFSYPAKPDCVLPSKLLQTLVCCIYMHAYECHYQHPSVRPPDSHRYGHTPRTNHAMLNTFNSRKQVAPIPSKQECCIILPQGSAKCTSH